MKGFSLTDRVRTCLFNTDGRSRFRGIEKEKKRASVSGPIINNSNNIKQLEQVGVGWRIELTQMLGIKPRTFQLIVTSPTTHLLHGHYSFITASFSE